MKTIKRISKPVAEMLLKNHPESAVGQFLATEYRGVRLKGVKVAEAVYASFVELTAGVVKTREPKAPAGRPAKAQKTTKAPKKAKVVSVLGILRKGDVEDGLLASEVTYDAKADAYRQTPQFVPGV